MKKKNQRYLFPVFWIGLIVTTYLKIGEYYIMLFTLYTGLLRLNKVNDSIIVHKKGGFKYFVLYYVIVSTFGLIADYVGIKNYIELLMKYIFLPVIIFYFIPNDIHERITMLKVLKALIYVSAIYGFIESIIKYNYMVNFVQLDIKNWMIIMNGSSNYQPCSFFLHYNYYGCVLILGLIIARYIPYKNKFLNYSYWVIVLEQILICQSRICWIAVIVISIIDVLQSNRITNKGLKRIIVVILAILCIIIFEPSLIVFLGEFISKRFSRFWIYGFEDGSLGQRLGTLMNWPIYFQNNPLKGFFGTGYQSISVEFMNEYSYFKGYSTADCQLTVYLVEIGIIGITILLLSIIGFFKQKRYDSDEKVKPFKIGKIGFIAYIVESFTLDIVSNNIILSLVLLMILIGNKRQTEVLK